MRRHNPDGALSPKNAIRPLSLFGRRRLRIFWLRKFSRRARKLSSLAANGPSRTEVSRSHRHKSPAWPDRAGRSAARGRAVLAYVTRCRCERCRFRRKRLGPHWLPKWAQPNHGRANLWHGQVTPAAIDGQLFAAPPVGRDWPICETPKHKSIFQFYCRPICVCVCSPS